MSEQAQRLAVMIDMLPEQEQNLAIELVKRIILAWDSDYTKLTPKETADLAAAEKSGYIDEQDIDWDNLGQY